MIDQIDGLAFAVGVIVAVFGLLAGVMWLAEYHPHVLAWLLGLLLIGFPLVWAALRFTVLK